jgi:hypothetical protein
MLIHLESLIRIAGSKIIMRQRPGQLVGPVSEFFGHRL